MGIFDENRKICEGAGSHLETKILEAAQATRYPPEAKEVKDDHGSKVSDVE